jgi:hypothetical protein
MTSGHRYQGAKDGKGDTKESEIIGNVGKFLGLGSTTGTCCFCFGNGTGGKTAETLYYGECSVEERCSG